MGATVDETVLQAGLLNFSSPKLPWAKQKQTNPIPKFARLPFALRFGKPPATA